ncbi:hypothetical protein B0H10DRAFT_1647301, partial [Mycena sp. CBHHK59/15]
PDAAKQRKHKSWSDLLPTLVVPLAGFFSANHARRPTFLPGKIQHACAGTCDHVITTKIQCLYISLEYGLFPTSPTSPRTAISIDLLEIYRALFERSCDAVTALASALHTIYRRKGFKVVSAKGDFIKDPFRGGLSHAIQWYSNLRAHMRRETDAVLAQAHSVLYPPIEIVEEASPSEPTEPSIASTPHNLTPGRAHRTLQERCPGCFSLDTWGRPFSVGGDVQLGADGCFSYRHLTSAGDGPIFYEPSYFLSKEKVDKVGERISAARKKKPNVYTSPVPKEAVDACEASWEAANEKKSKSDPGRYDSAGFMVMNCRHSHPIFLCNIDTPGEQRKYIVAMLEEVASMLPPQATITQCYDVACVTERTLHLFDILSTGLLERVAFVVNAMHSFGHQWVCQIVYSPRLRKGMGLTDAEGVERFWSRIRKLIGITRSQWNSRRIWMVDEHAAFVGEDMQGNLGNWIQRQAEKNIPKKRNPALRVLQQCGVSELEPRENWELQKAAQTSLRAHAPARLKCELDKVLSLQTQIDVVEKAIADAKQSITSSKASHNSLALLQALEQTHDSLNSQAEALYASLNIQDSFPELEGLPLDFVRTLLMMRDLKINIWKRAVGTFYEWETLDRAVRGHREALGTKLHQTTRKAIQKRRPALLKAIAKYNQYCSDLVALIPPKCPIPLPQPLSTELNGLRNDHVLHEDVWITPSEGVIPRWLNDSDVRDGIRALHTTDRCAEEVVRLQLERQNMSRWLDEEIATIEFVLESSENSHMLLSLRQRQEHLYFLKTIWGPMLVVHKATTVSRVLEPSIAAHHTINVLSTHPHPVPAPPFEFIPDDGLDDDDQPDDPGLSVTELVEELDAGQDSDMDEVITPNLTTDTTFIEFIENIHYMGDVDLQFSPRIVEPRPGHLRHEMEASDISRLRSPTGRLNNFALNGVAALLLSLLSGSTSLWHGSALRCALFTTLDLPRVRYRATDSDLWKHMRHTQYWTKDLWLLPIHRIEEHWVLCIVSVRTQQLFFFDSLSSCCGWRQDLIVSRSPVSVMHAYYLTGCDAFLLDSSSTLAPCAYHIFEHPARQSNGYDCGLWVLCTIGAILRGYHATGISENDIEHVRDVLTYHVLALPKK